MGNVEGGMENKKKKKHKETNEEVDVNGNDGVFYL